MSQYWDWVSGAVHGDLGESLTKQTPAWDLLRPALFNSFKLALVAFLICIPLSLLGGVIAGLRYGRATDKGITTAGLSVSAMPDFVSGIVLILVFGVWLGWLPVTAQAEDGASLLTQLEYLLLPAFTLTLVLFGYIARVTRAGMIEALDSDYARTAYLKGLPSSVVVRKHVLRNALVPTIAVIAVQVGYLVGGLVAVEYLFNYQGLGLLTYEAAQQQGPAASDRRRPRDRHGLPRRHAARRHPLRPAQSAHSLRGRRVSTFATPGEGPTAVPPVGGQVRGEGGALRTDAAPAPVADRRDRRDRDRILGLLRCLPSPRRTRTTRSSTTTSHRARRRPGDIRSARTRTAGTSSRAFSPARGTFS